MIQANCFQIWKASVPYQFLLNQSQWGFVAVKFLAKQLPIWSRIPLIRHENQSNLRRTLAACWTMGTCCHERDWLNFNILINPEIFHMLVVNWVPLHLTLQKTVRDIFLLTSLSQHQGAIHVLLMFYLFSAITCLCSIIIHIVYIWYKPFRHHFHILEKKQDTEFSNYTFTDSGRLIVMP